MFRTNYTAIQELTHASHPSVPFFVATLLGLAFIFLPAMFRRTNKFPVKGRVNSPLKRVPDQDIVGVGDWGKSGTRRSNGN